MLHAAEIHRFPSNTRKARLPTPDEVGNKACNLMRMARRDLPVPPGFVLGTSLCRAWLDDGPSALDGLDVALAEEIEHLGRVGGRRFGDGRAPLLVSVRSGAAVSMPGMMDTVLNIGLNDRAVEGLIRSTGNPRLAWDSYRRLIAQYGTVVAGLPPRIFETQLAERLAADGLDSAGDLDTDALVALTQSFAETFRAQTGEAFPQDPAVQLLRAVEAVLRSWSSDRAQSYRKMRGLSDRAGTATTVQQMVFGNAGAASGAGVGFTRDPATGANAIYLDFLANAQGEDVVAGSHNAFGDTVFREVAGDAHARLLEAARLLEDEFGDMQDFEFTVERGRLYLLQARSGKRTPLAALNIAVDLVEEGRITPAEALDRLADHDIDALEILSLAIGVETEALTVGVPASVGVAVGIAVFDPGRLAAFRGRNQPAILVREQASTEDVAAVAEAVGLITAAGARTSHAAVVARQLGKVCVVGCAGLRLGADGRRARFGKTTVEEGEILSVDGNSGSVFRGALDVRRERPTVQLAAVEAWRRTIGEKGKGKVKGKANAKGKAGTRTGGTKAKVKPRAGD